MFSDLLRLLEPAEYIFIKEVVLRPALPVTLGRADERGGKRHLREFTLAYLLTERGSRFNKKEYLTSLLIRMAAHDNLEVGALVDTIYATLAERARQAGQRCSELLDILGDIRREKKPLQPFFRPEAVSIVRSQEIYEQLHGLIMDKQGSLASGTDEAALFTELLERHPGQLERLLVEISLEKFFVFITTAPMHLVRALISTLIRLKERNDKDGDLLQAVERHAGRALSPRFYYRLILNRLRKGHPIDLEEILQLSNTGPSELFSLDTQALTHLLAQLRQKGVAQEFIQAVEQYAGRASNMDWYCTQIRTCLDLDQVIDFEDILAKNQQDEQHKTSDEPPRAEVPEDVNTTDPIQALTLPPSLLQIKLSSEEMELAAFLAQGHLSGTEQTALASLIEKMLIVCPSRLRFLLEAGVAATESMVECLAQVLSEATMSRIFVLLRPVEFPRLQIQADQL
ncbi:MAG: hypothetical protein D3924_16935, partial [Candidatus Electrothrix sp. AR4]|nr:hypothetical protein [Candidatus Electrothrix sp. AR4]